METLAISTLPQLKLIQVPKPIYCQQSYTRKSEVSLSWGKKRNSRQSRGERNGQSMRFQTDNVWKGCEIIWFLVNSDQESQTVVFPLSQQRCYFQWCQLSPFDHEFCKIFVKPQLLESGYYPRISTFTIKKNGKILALIGCGDQTEHLPLNTPGPEGNKRKQNVIFLHLRIFRPDSWFLNVWGWQYWISSRQWWSMLLFKISHLVETMFYLCNSKVSPTA